MKISPQLMTLRTLSAAMTSGILLITGLMLFIAPETITPPAWVWAVLLSLVALAAVGAYLVEDRIPSAAEGSTLPEMMQRITPVHMLRLALLEAPVILAVILALMGEEPSWVTVAIAAAPTLALMLLLAYPHQGLLKRYEKGLDGGGARTQFTDKLLGRTI